jgi:hypothetical protein
LLSLLEASASTSSVAIGNNSMEQLFGLVFPDCKDLRYYKRFKRIHRNEEKEKGDYIQQIEREKGGIFYNKLADLTKKNSGVWKLFETHIKVQWKKFTVK